MNNVVYQAQIKCCITRLRTGQLRRNNIQEQPN